MLLRGVSYLELSFRYIVNLLEKVTNVFVMNPIARATTLPDFFKFSDARISRKNVCQKRLHNGLFTLSAQVERSSNPVFLIFGF